MVLAVGGGGGLGAPEGAAARAALEGALADQGAATSRLRRAAASGDRAAALEACQEFESLFLHQLLQQMWATVPQGGWLDSGFVQDTYRDMYHTELARLMARSGGIGLARVLMEQLFPENGPGKKGDEQGPAEGAGAPGGPASP